MPKRTWLAKSTAVLSTGIMACFGLTGMAAAQSTITNTGANSINRIISSNDTSCYISNQNNIDVSTNNNQTAVSGDATSTENTSAYWEGWSDWNPASWQAKDASFTDWWSGMMNWLAQRTDSSNWTSVGNNPTWHPAGTNWQAAWSNWNPTMWQNNGQSYSNWNTQLMAYLNGNSGKRMMSWTGDGSGSVGSISTGNATNNYNANLSISVINGGGASGDTSCGGGATTSGGNGGGSIGNTGSGSTNVVSHGTKNHGHVLAANTVNYGSGNSQGAYSGANYATRNTGYGGAMTGSAGNNGGTQGTVGVSNSGGKGGGTSTPTPPAAPSNNATISNTGYNSTNVISSRTSNDTCITNTNNISYTSTNTQTATSGSVTSSQNTSGGGAGSGGATNNGGSGTSIGVKNN